MQHLHDDEEGEGERDGGIEGGEGRGEWDD